MGVPFVTRCASKTRVRAVGSSDTTARLLQAVRGVKGRAPMLQTTPRDAGELEMAAGSSQIAHASRPRLAGLRMSGLLP